MTIGSMAESFGVSVPFLDAELSNFIVSGRLNAKIDTVEGVVETNRQGRCCCCCPTSERLVAGFARLDRMTKPSC